MQKQKPGKEFKCVMGSLAGLSYLNIFRKFFIFLKYLSDNLSNGEWRLIWISFKYLLFKQSNSKDMVIQTNIGRFHIRKNTIDFKLANSAYELSVLEKFKTLLPICNLFIDVGANIGTYSMIAAGLKVNCIAFEPILSNFKSLEKNIELNNYKDFIQAFMFGLSDKNEVAKFNFDPLKPGASSIHPHKRMGEVIQVQLEKFDNLKLAAVDAIENILIKIDIEGMELNAIRGMKNTLRENKNIYLIIETKHSGEQNIKKLLKEFGNFKFENIDEFNMLAVKTI